jgi:lipopolysaccharide assembly protein A
MPILHRARHSRTEKSPTDPATAVAGDPTPETVDPAPPSTTTPTSPVPRTRTGAAWFGICAAALTLVVLIVFMLQNTRRVEVNFLWMDGSLPLALALLIAGVGVGLLTMVIGTARLTQLRKEIRDRRQRH